jgi:hypothetical protein
MLAIREYDEYNGFDAGKLERVCAQNSNCVNRDALLHRISFPAHYDNDP